MGCSCGLVRKRNHPLFISFFLFAWTSAFSPYIQSNRLIHQRSVSQSSITNSVRKRKTSTALQLTTTSTAVGVYLDEFDFCLDSMDSALSGPSMTKTLNSMTNRVIKNIIILNAPDDLGPSARELQQIREEFRDEFRGSKAYEAGLTYLDAVCALGEPGKAVPMASLEALPANYMLAYHRMLSILSDFGCVLGETPMGRLEPTDTDICLSVLDAILPDCTKTKVLNSISNRVCRTLCVGNDDDLGKLVREMRIKRPAVMEKWVGAKWQGSQEDLYYLGTMELLSKGLTAEPTGLNIQWTNSFKRLVAVLVRELGANRTTASDRIVTSFVKWERELRRDLTSDVGWDCNPDDLVGSWSLGDDMDLSPDMLGIGKRGAEIPARDQRVIFRRDGTVELPGIAGEGLKWRLDPGPTHLDTISFEVKANSNADRAQGGVLLSYTGYMDRGARIEARFSKRPLKMTGRLTRVVRGEERPSTRFSMRLVDKEEKER